MANNNHFELTLDTLAPKGGISGLVEFEKENKKLVIDGGDATFKKVWFDEEPNPTKEGEGYLGAEWEAKDAEVISAFTKTGVYYYHLVLMDDVNNESEIYTLGPVNYDQDKPVVSNIIVKDSRGNESNTNEMTLTYSFDYTDVGTGVVSAVVSGDDIDTITLDLVETNNHYEGTFTFKEGTEDGMKSISIIVYDKAGNVSDSKSSNSILLDRVLDKPTLLLKNEEGKNLPTHINYRNIVANLEASEQNIVAYKIWEGTEPEDWTTQEAGTLSVNKEMTLSASEGNKTIYAKVRDIAGNVVEAEPRSVIVDSIAPVAELASDVAIISNNEGYNKAILTFGKTADNEGGSGIVFYELTRNGVSIESGEVLPANHEVTVGALEDGFYTYILTVKDKAENITVSNEVVVKIDTTAPTVSIGTLNAWYTAKFNISVSYSDASSLAAMYVWTSTVAQDKESGETASIEPANEVASGNISWNLEESSENYMHVKLVDEVGNVNYAHAKFGYDTVAPEIVSCEFTQEAYPNTSAKINIDYKDINSSVVEMRVSGNITDGTADGQWETIVSSRNVTLTDGDGVKKVRVEIRDAAGLTASKEISCELDTTFPTPILSLFKADNSTVKPAHSALASFSVHLQITGDDDLGKKYYKLYGDFGYEAQPEGSIVKDSAEWKEYVVDNGQDYMSITNLFCTKGDGTKNIYVVVKDNAGNETPLVDPKSFVYDTTAPIVEVSDVDYNRISKVHVERRNSGGIIVGKFADETCFTFTPDSVIQAYKVCAYADASAAAAGSHNDAAIGMEHGSYGMSASGLNEKPVVNAKIKGADYEAALGGEGNDGAHIVVVYVQDLAGTWSVAAQF